jgi:hypothetical protein
VVGSEPQRLAAAVLAAVLPWLSELCGPAKRRGACQGEVGSVVSHEYFAIRDFGEK